MQYQSNKYTAKTAESEPVTVTLQKDMTFEVEQNSVTKFTLNFGTAMKSLNSVTVAKLLTVNDVEHELPQVIKAPTLAADGMSAVVELYSPVSDKTNYKFTVEGCEESVVKTVYAGKPFDLLVSAKEDNPYWPFVTVADAPATLYCHLYDVNGVEVTDNYKDKYFEFTEKTSSENFSVGDKNIWFAKENVEATVIVKFHSEEYDDNGNEVGNVEKEFTFVSQPAVTTAITGIPAATIYVGGTDTKKTSVPLGTNGAKLEVSIKLSTEKDPVKISANGDSLGTLGTVSFEETNADIFAISRSGDAELYLFKEGTAQVIVYLTDGNGKKTAIGAVPVTVSESRKLKSVSLDKSSVTVSTVSGLDEAAFKLNLKDNYNEDFKGSYTSNVEAVNTLAKDYGAALEVVDGKITVYGNDFSSYFDEKEKATSATFSYKVKVESNGQKFETSFTITVKRPTESATSTYSIEKTAGDWGEVARKVGSDNSKAAKTITFKMYELKNGVKNSQLSVQKYKDSKTLTAADENQYFLKITKNNTDVTTNDNVVFGAVSGSAVSGSAVSGSAVDEVTINFSGVNKDGVVTYDLGAGTYVVTLYKVVKQGEKYNYRTLRSLTGQTTLATGSYTKVSRNAGSAASSDAADLRACFVIKDTENKVTANENYTVQTKGDAKTGSLYVESITFKDEVAAGVYAEYKVNIGESVKIAK